MDKNKESKSKLPPYQHGRPITGMLHLTRPSQEEKAIANSIELQSVKKGNNAELTGDSQDYDDRGEAFKSEIERFIQISKYFLSPLRKTASYICENRLVSYPNPYRIQYKRGGVTQQNIKFCNLVLEPVYIKLYKLVPDLEQLKYINLSLSRSKRVPPGLSFNLSFVYDDVNEKPSCNAKMIFVASRKTTTPCYQICEIDLLIESQKIRDINRKIILFEKLYENGENQVHKSM
ncbi:uncharacterized protein LOC131854842 [Achroia grisella]|uniref:uncharacterized protein LOC131854842 n=1 Tax=Achroia grisella TaxID=688607 RepID=UPI0027D2372F|nr:uncharacterized protein LOC131854842 [Achroia grisella]